jgi:hypothetical protein
MSHACAALSSHACTPLNVLSLVRVAKVTSRQHVELVLLLVHTAVGEPEEDTGGERDDGDTAVVPDEMGVGSQGSEGLSKCSREGSGEALYGLDEGTHVLGCLGEGVLKGGDRGEDFRDGNEDIDTSDSPDCDGRLVLGVASLVEAGRFVSMQVSFNLRCFYIMLNLHVVLENGCPHHGEGTNEETSGDLLDGGEADALLAEEWVDQGVHDGDDDDNGNRVQVGQNVIGHTSQVHGSAHGSQVGVHLAVSEPEDGDPEKDRAGGESTADLIDPRVIEVVPLGRAGTERRRLDGVPHLTVVPGPVRLDGVDAESTAKRLEEELECRSHDVAGRGRQDVELLAVEENGQGDDEHDGGDEVSEPETNVALSVDHGDLTDKGTNVDEKVKVVVDAGHGNGGVDNNALALDDLDAHLLLRHLLGNEGRNVGLEGTSSGTHDEDTEDKDTKGRVGLVEDRWRRRGNENQVTNLSNNDRVQNGLEAAEVGVGDPGSEERADVDPKGVEGGQRKGNLLAHVEGTGDGLGIVWVKGGTGWGGSWLGDEVGVDGNGSVVRHALDQLDKGNGVDSPWDGGGHTAQRLQLLLGGEVGGAVRVAHIRVLHASLALRDEVGGGSSVVEGRLLALRVA